MSVSVEQVPFEVTRRGSVPSGLAAYARQKIDSALQATSRPVLFVHLTLDWQRDLAVEWPAVAEVTVDLDGRIVRATSAAPTMVEAADDLEARLRRRLVGLQDRDRSSRRRGGKPASHEWRHGEVTPARPPFFPRPVEDREIIRRKSFASAPLDGDEAVDEMEMLDHDFFLYTSRATGGPAIVYRSPDGGYGSVEAVALTGAQARERLDVSSAPFVFYVDADSGEGCVLYRRYDGNYGLIAAR